MNVTATAVTIALGLILLAQSPVARADGQWLAQASGAAPGRGAIEGVTVRGTVAAVDKDKHTVTLKGPKGNTLTLDVKDPAKLDMIKAGDPVVATYMEAAALQIRKAGTATPGATTQETRVSSKPGETPAGGIGREVTVTATITAIDKKAQTVTIKGPDGSPETIKAKDAKNLDLIQVGDLAEITYMQALAVSLDKPTK